DEAFADPRFARVHGKPPEPLQLVGEVSPVGGAFFEDQHGSLCAAFAVAVEHDATASIDFFHRERAWKIEGENSHAHVRRCGFYSLGGVKEWPEDLSHIADRVFHRSFDRFYAIPVSPGITVRIHDIKRYRYLGGLRLKQRQHIVFSVKVASQPENRDFFAGVI